MNILDFVMVGSDDHEKSGDFYDAVFEPLKLKKILKHKNILVTLIQVIQRKFNFM